MIATQFTTPHPLDHYGLTEDQIRRITDPTKRHDFVLLFDVSHGNPNGDPDAGNLPRVDPETMHGLVTDVAIKRKVRDYVTTARGLPIFIQSDAALNSLIYKAFRETGLEPTVIPLADDELIDWFTLNPIEGFSLEEGTLAYAGEATKTTDIQKLLLGALGDGEENKGLRQKLIDLAKQLGKAGTRKVTVQDRANAQRKLCETYYDIRMFGAVLQTGLNAGQVRGPMQLTFGRSIDAIANLNTTITRQARTTVARMESGTTEMGRKPIVLYGLYRSHGFFNPYLAEQTGASADDLTLFWEALCNMFQYDRSASRGEMAMRGLYIFTHESPLGNAPAHALFERVQIGRRPGVEAPRSFRDYEVTVDDKGLPQGVTLTRLVG